MSCAILPFFAIIVVTVVLNALLRGGGLAFGGPVRDFDRLTQGGIPARGIVLRVAQTSAGVGGPIGRRFQRRSVHLDIEIPGQAPYEVSAFAWIPMNCVRDVLPGATLELRVDPKNARSFVIVGPGVGFAPPLVPNVQQQMPSNAGYGR